MQQPPPELPLPLHLWMIEILLPVNPFALGVARLECMLLPTHTSANRWCISKLYVMRSRRFDGAATEDHRPGRNTHETS